MENMPYRPERDDSQTQTNLQGRPSQFAPDHNPGGDWRQKLPSLVGRQVTLRELRPSDAPSLCALLTTAEVARFISPPPTTVAGFEGFIAWTARQRTAGAYASFAVTVNGFDDTAIGIFQVRETEGGFATAEWGFAIGSPFWGTGVFEEGAELVLDFVFNTLGVHRLEARAAVLNGRGNRRAPEDRGPQGGHPAQVAAVRRSVSGSGVVRDARQRLARIADVDDH